MPLEPIDDKLKAFGWHTLRIDGHDYEQIQEAFASARATKERPTFIIADTVKGKGVSFMENEVGWHGKVPDADQTNQAVAELEALLGQ